MSRFPELRPWMLRLPIGSPRRGQLLRLFGAKIGVVVRVHKIHVMNPRWENLTIEDDVYVGPEAMLDLSDQLRIGRGAVLAARVSIMTHQDAGSAHGSPTAERVPTFRRPTRIGSNAFVGIGATILAGCNVGDGAVVGAGALVTRDVSPGSTVVGIPARSAGTSEARQPGT